MTEASRWLTDNIKAILEPPKNESIVDWMAHTINLPSDNAEPGRYNPDRAPYQRQILTDMSPQSPVRRITLAFGAQMGKTLMEMGAMAYYISAYPRPQVFAFSKGDELKEFVTTKFDPLINANPQIKAVLGMGLRSSGNTQTQKLYPGGFIRFAQANVESDLRSYSVSIVIMDERDTYPKDVGGNGDPAGQLMKRKNTFNDSSKVIESSTPNNEDSQILSALDESTYNMYQVPCPHCGKMIYLKWEYMKWDEREHNEKRVATDVWMECPECHGKIVNEDKDWMMDPANGAHWESQRPEASEEHQGYFLPSLYAPVGWLSWKNIVQEYLSALCRKTESEKVSALKTFFNTVLVEQYKTSQEVPVAEDLYNKYSVESNPYRRGIIPSWVNVLTTGADVQGNRIEVLLTGWGKRGRNIDIDRYVFTLGAGESMEDTENSAWAKYLDLINSTFTREDGFTFMTVGNAIDGGYKFDTVLTFALKYGDARLMVTRGINKELPAGEILATPKQKKMRDQGMTYYQVPVDNIKQNVYKAMLLKDEDGISMEDVRERSEFPRDFDKEYYAQLCSEEYRWVAKEKRMMWVKLRDRNEMLDCKTYNFAVYYYTGYNALSDLDWDDIAARQKASITRVRSSITRAVTGGRRVLSKGVEV